MRVRISPYYQNKEQMTNEEIQKLQIENINLKAAISLLSKSLLQYDKGLIKEAEINIIAAYALLDCIK